MAAADWDKSQNRRGFRAKFAVCPLKWDKRGNGLEVGVGSREVFLEVDFDRE